MELADASVNAGLPLYSMDQLDQLHGFSDVQFDSLGNGEGSAWDSFNSASVASGSDESISDVRAYETDADM